MPTPRPTSATGLTSLWARWASCSSSGREPTWTSFEAGAERPGRTIVRNTDFFLEKSALCSCRARTGAAAYRGYAAAPKHWKNNMPTSMPPVNPLHFSASLCGASLRDALCRRLLPLDAGSSRPVGGHVKISRSLVGPGGLGRPCHVISCARNAWSMRPAKKTHELCSCRARTGAAAQHVLLRGTKQEES